MSNPLDSPPRSVKEFTSVKWQEWFYLLWAKRKNKRIETNGNPAKGTSAPVETYLNNTVGLKFAVGDSVYFNLALPDDWVPNTDLTFEAHFYSSNTTAARYVRGSLDWQACALGEAITAPGSSGTLDTGDILMGTTANQLGAVAFPVIPGTSLSFDDHIFLKLTRTAATGTAPASPADNPVLMHFEIEYTAYVIRAR